MNEIKLPLKQGTFLDWEAYDSSDEICFIAFDGAEASPEKTAALVSIVNQRDQLLEALEGARLYVDMAGENCYNPVADKVLAKIDAAIAAAKGEV
jgi:hypothetical protein